MHAQAGSSGRVLGWELGSSVHFTEYIDGIYSAVANIVINYPTLHYYIGFINQ